LQHVIVPKQRLSGDAYGFHVNHFWNDARPDTLGHIGRVAAMEGPLSVEGKIKPTQAKAALKGTAR
jgi:hypothetical protein